MILEERAEPTLTSTDAQGVLALDLVAGETVLVLEACDLVWIIDTERQQFCRLARSAALRSRLQPEWSNYHRALIASDHMSALLLLDPLGSRVLRVRAHHLPCSACGAASNDLVHTAELIGLAWR